jgi:hypothetical protein
MLHREEYDRLYICWKRSLDNGYHFDSEFSNKYEKKLKKIL